MEVRAEEPLPGAVLAVEVRVRADGTGEPWEETAGEAVIWRGDLPAGLTRVPFAVPLPNGPLSFRGVLFQVAWRLRARLEAPGLRRAVEEAADFQLAEAAPGEAYRPGPKEPHRSFGAVQVRWNVLLNGALGIAGFGVGGVLLAKAVEGAPDIVAGSLGSGILALLLFLLRVLVGLGAVGVALVFLVPAVVNAWQGRGLRGIEVEAEPEEVRRGERVRVRVRIPAGVRPRLLRTRVLVRP